MQDVISCYDDSESVGKMGILGMECLELFIVMGWITRWSNKEYLTFGELGWTSRIFRINIVSLTYCKESPM